MSRKPLFANISISSLLNHDVNVKACWAAPKKQLLEVWVSLHITPNKWFSAQIVQATSFYSMYGIVPVLPGKLSSEKQNNKSTISRVSAVLLFIIQTNYIISISLIKNCSTFSTLMAFSETTVISMTVFSAVHHWFYTYIVYPRKLKDIEDIRMWLSRSVILKIKKLVILCTIPSVCRHARKCQITASKRG